MSDEVADALVAPVRSALLAEGRVLVAKTVVDGRPCNKLTLLNPETTVGQVTASLEHVVRTAERVHAAATAAHATAVAPAAAATRTEATR